MSQNGHSTSGTLCYQLLLMVTVDVLWAGVPLLTLPGEKLASRVAASLIVAVECPEMIVGSFAEYEQRAVELATNPLLLKQLRDKLKTNRLKSKLFDTHLW